MRQDLLACEICGVALLPLTFQNTTSLSSTRSFKSKEEKHSYVVLWYQEEIQMSSMTPPAAEQDARPIPKQTPLLTLSGPHHRPCCPSVLGRLYHLPYH